MTNVKELKTATMIRAKFAQDRHKEKLELTNLRFNQSMNLIDRRDKFSKDRHKERIEMLQ